MQINNTAATAESIVANSLYTTRKRQLRKAGTVTECIIRYLPQGRGKSEPLQERAAIKCIRTDAVNTLLYHSLAELGAVEWTIIPTCIRNAALHIHLTRRFTEYILAKGLDSRGKTRNLKVLQALEGILTNRLNTFGNYHFGKALTVLEGIIQDAAKTGGKGNLGQTLTILKSPFTDAHQAGGKRYGNKL